MADQFHSSFSAAVKLIAAINKKLWRYNRAFDHKIIDTIHAQIPGLLRRPMLLPACIF